MSDAPEPTPIRGTVLRGRAFAEDEVRLLRALRQCPSLSGADATFVEALLIRSGKGLPVSEGQAKRLLLIGTAHWDAVAATMRKPRPERASDAATDLCEIWGLRTVGGSLKTAMPTRRTGASPGVDEALCVSEYVEDVPDFDTAQPALLHRFGFGLDLAELYYRRPGETLTRALMRLGWFGYFGVPEREIPGRVVAAFLGRLTQRLQEQPLVLPRAVEELTGVEIGEEESARLASDLGTRRQRQRRHTK